MEPTPKSQSSTTVDDAFRRRLAAYEARMHPNYDLRFNGRQLVLHENGGAILNWPAVSGRPGKQVPEFQAQRDQGPLPEGDYQFKVSMTRSAIGRSSKAHSAGASGEVARIHGGAIGSG